VYAVEATKGNNVAYWTSFCGSGANLGSLLAIGIIAVMRSMLKPIQFSEWGWRIPFLITPILAVLGLYVRLSIKDEVNEELIKSIPPKIHIGIYRILVEYWREVINICFILASWPPIFYICFVWTPFYLSNLLPVEKRVRYPFPLCFFMLIVHTTFMPCCGYLIDDLAGIINNQHLAYRFGMITAVCWLFIFSIPIFMLLSSGLYFGVVLGYLMLVTPLALFGGSMSPFIVNQFPDTIRLSGNSHINRLSTRRINGCY